MTTEIKIYDCFLFNNELDVLELKLTEMSPHIDVFVIGEAPRTFKGTSKPMLLKENWDRYSRWHDKIRYIEIDLPADPDPWVNENLDREELKRGLYDANPDDIIICSDADEIYRADVMTTMRKYSPDEIISFDLRMPQFVYKFNNWHYNWITADNIQVSWHCPCLATRFSNLGGIEEQRKLRIEKPQQPKCAVVWHAGWHFTFIGDNDFVKAKIENFDYTWLSKFKDTDLNIDEDVKAGQYMGTKEQNGHFARVMINEYMPVTLQTNPYYWEKFLVTTDGPFYRIQDVFNSIIPDPAAHCK